jgi:hypothetical protein
VIGTLAAFCLRGLAFVLRLTGNIFRYLGKALVNLYNLIIFAPLWMESVIANRHSADHESKATSSGSRKTRYQEAA